jgi:hypothetical protein
LIIVNFCVHWSLGHVRYHAGGDEVKEDKVTKRKCNLGRHNSRRAVPAVRRGAGTSKPGDIRQPDVISGCWQSLNGMPKQSQMMG